jgi:predicted RNA binding protein YcfA (HicA-like mRNA interferase family)
MEEAASMASEKSFREIRATLKLHGWNLARIHGSHHIFEKTGQANIVIPVHRGKVKPGYGRIIEKRLREEEN